MRLFSLAHMATATLEQPPTASPQPAPPQAGESRESFTVRAHRELMQTIPDPNARNAAVWNTWDSRYGDPLRSHADAYFSPDQFAVHRDVCLWHEHESVVRDPQGNEVVRNNDVNRLANILAETNLRIEDTDAYAALTDKHTSTSSRDPDPPKTLGYIGRYRLGMVGRVNPRFALFADEYHRKDRAEVLRDRPRRSVEVLTLKANGRSYIDPVAALSEPPRLPLPVQVYQAGEAEEGYRERYEAVPAFPGGSNMFLPAGGKRKADRDHYSPLADDAAKPERQMAITSEDLTMIVDAISSTPQFQFLTQLMQQSQSDPSGGVVPAGGEGGESPETPAGPSPAPSPAAPTQPDAPGAPMPAKKETFGGGGGHYALPLVPIAAGMAGGQAAQRFGAGSPDDDTNPDGEDQVEREQYAALQQSHDDLAEKYQAMADDNVKLMGEVAELRQGFAEVRAREVDADRKLQLRSLHNQHPHFVDLDREESKCLYSAGSQMDDEQFAAHLEDLETYAAKAPPIMGRMVPGGESPPVRSGVETERFSADISAKAVEIYTAAVNSGQRMTTQEAYAKAQEKLAG